MDAQQVSSRRADLLVEAVKLLPPAQLNLSKFAKDVHKLSSVEVTPLHVAAWRNHLGLLEKLLAAVGHGLSSGGGGSLGTEPLDARDGESGWTPLHRALYAGNLAAASLLLAAGASLDVADRRGRSPPDLVSEARQAHARRSSAAAGGPASPLAPEAAGRDHGGVWAPVNVLYSWGSGANFCLGTGTSDDRGGPGRVEGPLAGVNVVSVCAAKFHSAALDDVGRVWTWGWGRGGRLGHAEFEVASGGVAAVVPRQVVCGLGRRQVVALAAAKHHMLAATAGGELFSWGSNKDCGRLGYGGCDTQPTPKKVAQLRGRVVAVAAANKHSAAVTATGEVHTWGSNDWGQLGYGTVDSGCSWCPRLVESLKGRCIAVAVSAAKRHTLVLSAEGEVFTFGHRAVAPRKVTTAGARDTARSTVTSSNAAAGGGAAGAPGTSSVAAASSVMFHRGHSAVTRPFVCSIAAGHGLSLALTRDGVVLAWRSADPSLAVAEVGGPLAGRRVLAVSAGKWRCAAVTATGDLYVWVTPNSSGGGRGRGAPGEQCEDATSDTATFSIASGGIALGSSPPVLGSSPPQGGAGRGGSSFLTGAAELLLPRRSSSSSGPGGTTMAHAAAAAAAAAAPLDKVLLSSSPGAAAAIGSSSSSSSGSSVGPLVVVRVPGVKRLTGVAVGEKHSLGIQSWWRPPLEADLQLLPVQRQGYNTRGAPLPAAGRDGNDDEEELLGDELLEGRWGDGSGGSEDDDDDGNNAVSGSGSSSSTSVPRLEELCQRVVASKLVDPRAVLPVLEWADVAGASRLRSFCLSVALANLDAVLLEGRPAFERLSPHLLAELEVGYRGALAACGPLPPAALAAAMRSAGISVLPPHHQHQQQAPAGVSLDAEYAAVSAGAVSASSAASSSSSAAPPAQAAALLASRLQPGSRPTAAPAWLAGTADNERLLPEVVSRLAAAAAAVGSPAWPPTAAAQAAAAGGESAAAFSASVGAEDLEVCRLQRTISRKLGQIGVLEGRLAGGELTALDPGQAAKVGQKAALMEAAAALTAGVPAAEVAAMLAAGQAIAAKLVEVTTTASSAAGLGAGAGGMAQSASKPPRPPRAADKAAASSNEVASSPAPALTTTTAAPRTPSPSALVGPSRESCKSADDALEWRSKPSGGTPAASTSSVSEPWPTSDAVGRNKDYFLSAATTPPASVSRTKGRKGGLSLFLSGALDVQPPAAAAAAAAITSSGSAPKSAPWSAAAASSRPEAPLGSSPAGSSSLRQILQQEEEQQQQAAAAAVAVGSSHKRYSPAATPGTSVGRTSSLIRDNLVRPPPPPPPSSLLPCSASAAVLLPRSSSFNQLATELPAATGASSAGSGSLVLVPGSSRSSSTGKQTLTLLDFMASRQPPAQAPAAAATKAPAAPAWGGAGAVVGGSSALSEGGQHSAGGRAPAGAAAAAAATAASLRDIQAEQAQQAAAAAASWGATASSSGRSGALLGTSPGRTAISTGVHSLLSMASTSLAGMTIPAGRPTDTAAPPLLSPAAAYGSSPQAMPGTSLSAAAAAAAAAATAAATNRWYVPQPAMRASLAAIQQQEADEAAAAREAEARRRLEEEEAAKAARVAAADKEGRRGSRRQKKEKKRATEAAGDKGSSSPALAAHASGAAAAGASEELPPPPGITTAPERPARAKRNRGASSAAAESAAGFTSVSSSSGQALGAGLSPSDHAAASVPNARPGAADDCGSGGRGRAKTAGATDADTAGPSQQRSGRRGRQQQQQQQQQEGGRGGGGRPQPSDGSSRSGGRPKSRGPGKEAAEAAAEAPAAAANVVVGTGAALHLGPPPSGDNARGSNRSAAPQEQNTKGARGGRPDANVFPLSGLAVSRQQTRRDAAGQQASDAKI